MFCPSCGAPNDDGARFCRNCGATIQAGAADPAAPVGSGPYMGQYPPQSQPGYGAAPLESAGFWIRVDASLIDGVILSIASFIVTAILGTDAGAQGLAFLINLVGGWLYYTLMESSERQATLGKMALGIVVTDTEGRRISFGKATGRYFAKILSGLILLIGYIMVAFDGRKQGLHDKLAGTLVVRRQRS